MTADELRQIAETADRVALEAERVRHARNEAIRSALAENWTHAQIAEATGLTRGRIGQIAAKD